MQHVVATGESIGAVNLLFRVNDRFESILRSHHRLFHQLCQAAPGGQTATGQYPAISSERGQTGSGREESADRNQQTSRSADSTLRDRPDVRYLLWRLATVAAGRAFDMPVADAMRVVDATMKAEAGSRW